MQTGKWEALDRTGRTGRGQYDLNRVQIPRGFVKKAGLLLPKMARKELITVQLHSPQRATRSKT